MNILVKQKQKDKAVNMTSNQFVREVFKLLGLQGNLSLPETISFDEEIQVTISSFDKYSIVLEGTVFMLSSSHNSDSLLKQILRLNMGRMREQKDVLCLDQSMERIVLYRRVEFASYSPNDFLKILESFVNNIEYWQKTVQNLDDGNSNRSLTGAVNIVIP